MKISEIVPHIDSEGSLFQIFYIGPSFYFIKEYFENVSNVTCFFVFLHKIITKPLI